MVYNLYLYNLYYIHHKYSKNHVESSNQDGISQPRFLPVHIAWFPGRTDLHDLGTWSLG